MCAGDDHATGYLIAPWAFLGPKRRKMLDESWAGVFREHVFTKLPVAKLAGRFDAAMGRPTKALYRMMGAPVLQQLQDLTDMESPGGALFRPAVAELASYQMLMRVIEEQCTVTRDKDDAPPVARLKPPKEVPSDSLQNPSDPEAGYSGHKGRRRSWRPTLRPLRTMRPCWTSYVNVTPANIGDSGALVPALETTVGRGCGPQAVMGDSAYGSDDNHQAVTGMGIDLVAPTAGGNDARNGDLGIKDFAVDKTTLTIKACPRGQAATETKPTPKGRFPDPGGKCFGTFWRQPSA